jgi:hypothetical protein
MKKSRYLLALGISAAALSLLLAAAAVRAQDDQGPAPTDPPTRVARLSFLYGSVSFQPAGESDWVAASQNRPLTSGDSLWLDAGARAELRVGSTALRLGQSTSVTLLEVGDRVLQVRVAQGSMILHARHLGDDDLIEADTPNLAFSVQAPGEYRIDVNADGTSTSASVWNGKGLVNGGGRSYSVVAGQQARFEGLDTLNYEINEIPRADALDSWAQDRDRRDEHSTSANYVSPEMTGYEDLDANGQWSMAPGYGAVWTPTGVPVGWAPYRYGRWAWIEPWGWTWIDDQPWGFAPFHYGRWAYVGTGWVWVPGPVVARPVYGPALVAFVGGGPGARFGLAVGGGVGVGWFPLGPGEVYVPAYRVSPYYVRNVNVTNTRVEAARVTTVYNAYTAPGVHEGAQVTYMNRAAPGAVTVVTHETFVGARPVGANVVAVNQEELARAPVTHMAAVAPERTSVIGAAAVSAAAPPAAMQNRRVVSNRTPPPPPQAFAQRQEQLNAHPGQPAVMPAAAPHEQQAVTPAEAAAAAAAARRSQPAATPTTGAPQEKTGNPPARTTHVYEQVEPPPPPPAPAKQGGTASQASGQGTTTQNRPGAQQPTPAPKPSTTAAPKTEPQQKPQQQQQQKPAPPKNNKPPQKEKPEKP